MEQKFYRDFPAFWEGAWTNQEKDIIIDKATQYIHWEQDWVGWTITKFAEDDFTARRNTWSVGCYRTKTVEYMATKIYQHMIGVKP